MSSATSVSAYVVTPVRLRHDFGSLQVAVINAGGILFSSENQFQIFGFLLKRPRRIRHDIGSLPSRLDADLGHRRSYFQLLPCCS